MVIRCWDKALPGCYSTQLGLVEIERKGDRLEVNEGHESFNLVLREDGHYRLQYKLLGLLPIGLGVLGEFGLIHDKVAGREVLIARHEGHKVVAGEKIHPKPVPEAWRARLGRYEVIDAQPRLALEDGNIALGKGASGAGVWPTAASSAQRRRHRTACAGSQTLRHR